MFRIVFSRRVALFESGQLMRCRRNVGKSSQFIEVMHTAKAPGRYVHLS